jgi:hypothetical protein
MEATSSSFSALIAVLLVVGGNVVVEMLVEVCGGCGATTQAELNTTGRHLSGRGHASRSMLRALFEIVTTN